VDFAHCWRNGVDVGIITRQLVPLVL